MSRAKLHTTRGNPWLTLVSVSLGLTIVGLNGTAVSIALPSIAKALDASLSDLQWVTSSYLLVVTVCLIVGGKLGDRFGRRRIFMIGMTGFAATSLVCGRVDSIEALIALRGVQGLFGAMLLPNTLAILRTTFPPSQLKAAVGIWGGASAAAVAAGPIVGGLLVEHASWRAVFYVNLPVALIAVVLGTLVINESRDTTVTRPDLGGTLALAAGLFLLVFGLIKAEAWGWGSGATLALLVSGGVFLAVFIAIESRTKTPLVPLDLFTHRGLSVGASVKVLGFLALFGTLFYMTLFLQNVKGYSPVHAGVAQLPLTTLFVVSAPLGGVMNARWGSRVTTAPAMLLVGLGLLSFTDLSATSGYGALWPGFVAIGLGFGAVVAAASDEIVEAAPVREAGIAGGINSTSQQLGAAIGTSLLGSLLAVRSAASLYGHLIGAGLPGKLAQALATSPRFKAIVGEGIVPPTSGQPRAIFLAIARGSQAAFSSGLSLAMLVAACACFAGAAIAFAFLPRHQVPQRRPAAPETAPHVR